MINFNNFYHLIAKNCLSNWLEILPKQISIWKKNSLHNKQFKKWHSVVEQLPTIIPYKIDLLHGITAKVKTPLNESQKTHIRQLMRKLMPWRKGPFLLYGLHIDAEWRSDWKWNRIFPHISDLNGRTVLDVGCGSGYHLWRMLGVGARLVVGIDPIQLFLYQFEAIRKLLGNKQSVYLLPLRIEQMPELNSFDTVFSMGVLYHCRSPLEHLLQLKNQLVNGGELVLETLIIKGDNTRVLIPRDRYARMRNVYFIPSTLSLKNWLEKCGFTDIRIVNTCITSTDEQRRTEWMTSNSLFEALDPNNKKKTIEGYPAPIRAILIAKKP